MKAKFFITALIVLVSAVTFANGSDRPRLAVVSQTNSNSYKVIYQGEKIGNVKMTILNEKGEVLFSETTKGVNGFSRPVNFAGMSAGEYTIEVADESGKEVQKVTYGSKATLNQVHVAKISESGKYLLSVGSQGKDEINVRIFDGAHNLVHSEDLTINGNYGLVYNLKSIVGTPTFEVTDNVGNLRTIR